MCGFKILLLKELDFAVQEDLHPLLGLWRLWEVHLRRSRGKMRGTPLPTLPQNRLNKCLLSRIRSEEDQRLSSQGWENLLPVILVNCLHQRNALTLAYLLIFFYKIFSSPKFWPLLFLHWTNVYWFPTTWREELVSWGAGGGIKIGVPESNILG